MSRKGRQRQGKVDSLVEWGGSTPTSERGGSGTQKIILEIDESGSTGMTSSLAMHDPSAGLEFLIGRCMGIRCDMYSLKSSVAVRALDVRRPIIGLCTFLEGEGGGSPFVDFRKSHLGAKLIVSACRGEVFRLETPSHTIFRINNFDFHACCIDALMRHRRTQQTCTLSDVESVCVTNRHNDYFSRHAFARLHSLMCVCYMCSFICLSLHASTNTFTCDSTRFRGSSR